MNGAQADIPAFLINIHKVETEQDARDYVSRIRATGTYIDQAVAESSRAREAWRAAAQMGLPAGHRAVEEPDHRRAVRLPGRTMTCSPISRPRSASSTFPQETQDGADRRGARRADRIGGARLPAADRHADQDQQKRAGTDDGIWRFPDGAAQYQALLKFYTTTDLTPDQVHELGLAQVARIHGEMEAIKQQVGFKGTLQQFFAHIRDGKQFYYPNTAAGKQAYLDESKKAQAQVQAQLPRYFGQLPKTALLIKPVEPFREKSAGKAFYNDPPPDGSRPGTYYVNLYDMKNMPSIEVEVLFCHEGIPGHHLQGALLSELPKGAVPPFRQFSGYTATDEGWGLYAEKLCKEMGLYQDPYRDFGRLQLELHRAIRLVVDSGIHHKRWTREQAIKYVEDNSAPTPRAGSSRRSSATSSIPARRPPTWSAS